MIRPGSILVRQDGMGFFYGTYKDRTVNIRREMMRTRWRMAFAVYVDGELVARDGSSLQNAEELAKHFIDVVLEPMSQAC